MDSSADAQNGKPTFIDSSLILTNLNCSTFDEAVSNLSDLLVKSGYAKEGFFEAVINREREFPTGLPCEIPVAIPHCDPEYVRESSMAVAVLSNPVEAIEMGSKDQRIKIEMVFLLALADSDLQTKWLSKLVNMFQDCDTLEDIKDAEGRSEVERILKTHLT